MQQGGTRSREAVTAACMSRMRPERDPHPALVAPVWPGWVGGTRRHKLATNDSLSVQGATPWPATRRRQWSVPHFHTLSLLGGVAHPFTSKLPV